jgi:hypothetical protein
MKPHVEPPGPASRRKVTGTSGRQDVFAPPSSVAEVPEALPAKKKMGSETKLKAVLERQWSVSPLDSISVAAGVTAILGCFVHIDLFVHRHQKQLIRNFLKDYENAELITDASLCDKFLQTLSLWNCVLNGPRIDQAAAAHFAEKLIVLLRRQFMAFITPVAESLVPVAETFLDSRTDPEPAARQLNQRINQVFRSDNFPDRLESLFRQQLIRCFDAKCVALITAKPTRPTAERAVAWKSTLTVCEVDCGLSLPLFKEAALVLQGSMALCADPTLKDVMTPGLPPEVVLHLLASQRPDDFCPINNDVTAFSAHFNLTPDKMTSIVPVEYDGNFEGIAEILATDWDTKRLKPDVAEAFPFLAEFVLDGHRQ